MLRHTLLFFALAATALCCNVPVFRYALERWESDPFQLVVFADQPLPTDLEQQLKALEPLMDAGNARPNWKIIRVDVAKAVPSLWGDVWAGLQKAKTPLPHVALCTPEWTKGDAPLLQMPLTSSSLNALIDSPKRSAIRDQIMKGTAVTWVLLESSDAVANQKLRTLLNTESQRLVDVIPIPTGLGKDGVNVLSDLPVEVSFATITVRADDPAEATLVKLLTNGDEVTEPMLYPIFGRGRVLAAMIASSVNAELLEETARFLCGACSCQIKAQNPGFDLLLTAHWESLMMDGAAPAPEKPTAPSTSPKPSYVPIPSRKTTP
jgi:hypothetical protein